MHICIHYLRLCIAVPVLHAYKSIYIYIGNIGPEEIAIGDFNKDCVI